MTELAPAAPHEEWSLVDAALFDHARLQAKFPLAAKAPAGSVYDYYNPDVIWKRTRVLDPGQSIAAPMA
ncbi:MAG: hypothetical protein ACC700_15755 [Anaerolineales bacterium]